MQRHADIHQRDQLEPFGLGAFGQDLDRAFNRLPDVKIERLEDEFASLDL